MITTSPWVRSTQPAIETPRADGDGGAGKSVTDLLAALHRLHPNILIVGAGIDTDRVLAHIRPTLRTPVASWSPTDTPHLPTPAFQTLIVRDVDSLTGTQQASLTALLGRSAGELQIVAIARRPLFPLVTQGLFLDELYYRLNAVLLEGDRPTEYGW